MDHDKASILIIDDEQALRESLAAVLENAGYEVSCAEDGGTALSRIKEKFFDILLVDYMLPDMNGIEYITQALPLSKDSVPLIVTGSSSIEIAVEAMRIGAHDYLLKPVNMDDLLKILSCILREREELRKGKLNLESVMGRLTGGAEPDVTAVVLADDRSLERKNSAGFLTPVKQIIADIVWLVKHPLGK